MKKDKILIFFPKIGKGGIEKNFYWFINKFSSNNYLIDILSFEYSISKIKFNKNVRFIKLAKLKKFDESNILTNIKVFYLIFRFFINSNRRYNFVFSFKSHLIILLFTHIFNLKIIVRISNYFGYNKYEKKFYKVLINFIKFKIYKLLSYKIIAPSKELSIELLKKHNLKTTYIANPVDDYLFKNRNKLKKKENNRKRKIWNLISVGRLSLQKNYIDTIKAIFLLINNKKIKNIRLSIFGEGEQKKNLEKLVNNLNLNKYIFFRGHKKDIYKYLSKSDIYILSSLYEGMPNSLIEAIMFNNVIISSKCKTGPKEILRNGKLGLLYETQNVEQLSNLIFKAIENFNFYKKKFKPTNNDIKRYYSSKIFNKYKDLMD